VRSEALSERTIKSAAPFVCGDTYSGRNIRIFRRNLLSLSSGNKSSTLKKKVECFSETLVDFYKTTTYHVTERIFKMR
jgi:hypothetical protein